jgi:hypothetical protein
MNSTDQSDHFVNNKRSILESIKNECRGDHGGLREGLFAPAGIKNILPDGIAG